jgi:methylated-DNA-protein-cysteine methyltransferase-like protein
MDRTPAARRNGSNFRDLRSLDGVFRRRVYEIVRLVPFGQVTTYGFVATLAGMPRHARQVGWALHTLPAELVWGGEHDERHRGGELRRGSADAGREASLGRVPWHRVINAKGQVSTHPDEAGTRRQIELLREEGIEVTDDGTLVGGLATHQWQPAPALVEGLDLPAEALYAIDRLLDQ